MGQEFIIKSQILEDKINQLLPSQGGFQAGVDLSASTQIIPIVDLTESAEGSTLRADLQSAFSHNTTTSFFVENTTTTIVNTTGYWLVKGTMCNFLAAGAGNGNISLVDSAGTEKVIYQIRGKSTVTSANIVFPFEFMAKLDAGDFIQGFSASTVITVEGACRQIASLDGTLVNP